MSASSSWWLWLVACAAAASAWNTHRNGFVWDDRAAVVANKDVSGERALHELFARDFWGMRLRAPESHKSYRPLTVLSFRLSRALAAASAGGEASNSSSRLATDGASHFHVANALVHVGCSLLVWQVARALFVRHGSAPAASVAGADARTLAHVGAALSALLFAVHPVHSDAVASVVGRADLLCTLLALQAFRWYMAAVTQPERTHWRAFTLSLVCAVAASLCKELGFTVLGLFLVYDVTTHLAGTRAITLVLFTLALTVLRVRMNGEHRQREWNILANNVAVQRSQLTRVFSYAHIHAWYLWKLVWPRSLCFDYGFKTVPIITSVWDVHNLFTLLAYGAMALGVGVGVRKQLDGSPLVLICIAFGVIPFVPASNLLFPVGTVVAERLLYFPSVGFCLLVGHILQTALGIATDFFRWCYSLTVLCIGFLLVSGCYRSQIRNAEWADEKTLYRSALRVSPTNNKVLSNVGKTLLGENEEEAVRVLRVATALLPRQIEGHINLGLAHWHTGKVLLAARHLYKAANFSGGQIQSTGFAGAVFLDHSINENQAIGGGSEGFWRSPTMHEARRLLDVAIEAESFYPIHYFSRARLAYYAGEFEDTVRLCDLALRANELVLKRTIDSELVMKVGQIHNLIAIAHMSSGRPSLALEAILSGLQSDPNNADLHANAAILYAEQKKGGDNGNKASYHLNAFLRLATTPSSRSSLDILADALDRLKEPEAAAACRKQSRQLASSDDATASLSAAAALRALTVGGLELSTK